MVGLPYWEIGNRVKPEVQRLFEARLGQGVRVFFGSYWGKDAGIIGQFNLLCETKPSVDLLTPDLADLTVLVEEIFRTADQENECDNHRVGVALWYSGQPNLPPLYRQD